MPTFPRFVFWILLIFTMLQCVHAQQLQLVDQNIIQTGAQQTQAYFPMLKGKRVGLVTNHTGLIGTTHLTDSLLSSGIKIQRIFTPEHGFRGNEDAGASVSSFKDQKTGVEVSSLYGQKKKPTVEDLKDIDIICFDLQDVGVRFYTYISTLTYIMEACAEQNIPLIVLDRPNPNGFYIDGPVLESEFKSFVGLHPVPVVYGLTIGEYAQLVNGEGWLGNGKKCNLTVIKLIGYQRNMLVKLAVKPSPNLPTWESVYLYPSLCFFEGTIVSVGRGTPTPFEVFGHPALSKGSFSFTPKPMKGASKPKLNGEKCYGLNLNEYAKYFQYNKAELQLNWLIDTFKTLSSGNTFFNNYFDTLAGTAKMRKQIEAGLPADEIRNSWQEGINRYKKIRAKYLLYPDH
ncbi:MAG: putative lipoprotein [Bacteroidetes bacterium]|nr:MAG: putative lipoprotein [Bacteroidota bacterium]